MLMTILDHLRRADVQATVGDAPDGVDGLIELKADGLKQVFAVEQRRRAPYPSEIRDLGSRLIDISDHGAPLLIAPYISENVGRLLTDYGWSWADSVGNFGIRSRGLRLFQRIVSSPPTPPRHLPQGKGALGIVRFLIRMSDEAGGLGPTELSKIASVSQPRASQVLSQLERLGFVEKARDGYRADREALLDAFVTEYRGPGGTELFLYSLDPPTNAALQVVEALPTDRTRVAVSADVGPDLIASWRSPTVAVIYCEHPVDMDEIDMVGAPSLDQANVVLRFPDDTSVFRHPPLDAKVSGNDLPLTDETQMIWDLLQLGGDDRHEAADRLRQALLGLSGSR
jgi:DNA-binding transcriptional ArsR family regulator